MRLAWVIAVCACGGPATKPAGVANKAAKPSGDPVDKPLAFEGKCDTDSTEWFPINAREKLAVVTCRDAEAPQSDASDGSDADGISYHPDVTAWLARGPSKTTGRQRVLGVWETQMEGGESFGVEAVLRGATGDATHVLIRHGKGGLDQMPSTEILDYLVASDSFATARSGLDIRVEVGAGAAAARLIVCNLTPGGTYYQDKECRDQQGAKLETFTIGP